MTAPIEVVRNPRARRARLSVDRASGRVRLTLPPRAALSPALAWARSQQLWIDTQQAAIPAAIPFTSGAVIPFRGELLTLIHDPAARRLPGHDAARLTVGGPLDGFAGRVERWLRREARALLTAETSEFAARVPVGVTRVAIGDPRSRWGSCASGGVIRYSWRLILAPDAVRRATVAHEVAHRIHMNHGPQFHALVASLVGADAARARAWLAANGAALHRIGRYS